MEFGNKLTSNDGDTVPLNDNKWECFLLLLDILQFSMAKIATRGHAGVLEAHVDTHHQAFVCCYPDATSVYHRNFTMQCIFQGNSLGLHCHTIIIIVIIMLSYLCITYNFV